MPIDAATATFAFDTNQIRGKTATHVAPFNHLVARVNLLRKRAALPLQLVVPAIVVFEMVHQLKREKGDQFVLGKLTQQLVGLRDQGLLIESFDGDTAERAGEKLAVWFPDGGSWRTAKETANGRAAIDWLIATQASVRGWIVVTEDHAGGEFAVLHRSGHCVTRAWLEQKIQILCQQHGID